MLVVLHAERIGMHQRVSGDEGVHHGSQGAHLDRSSACCSCLTPSLSRRRLDELRRTGQTSDA